MANLETFEGTEPLKTSRVKIINNFTKLNGEVVDVTTKLNLLGLSWEKDTYVPLGKRIYCSSIPSGCIAAATTAGTTGSFVPDFSVLGMGGSVQDGSVVWTVMSSVYVYAEGDNFEWTKHFNPSSGTWKNSIREWGYSGARHTTFPVTFGTCLQVYAQYAGTGVNTYNRDNEPININASGFDIYETSSATLPYRWFAIGV